MLVVIGTGGYHFYQKIYFPNVLLKEQKSVYIHIPTGSGFEDVHTILREMGVLERPETFAWVSRQMGYTNAVRPGRYELKHRMTNKELVALLRSGRQSPVKLVFNNIRTVNQLAGVVSRQIEADSASIVNLLHDSEFLQKEGLSRHVIAAMFIPNTYEVYWNTSAEAFFDRMKKEYSKFWNTKRKKQADKIGMDPFQVSTLASIVEQESVKADERPMIAGVYINRLNRNWKLEADPTLIFALGDFTIRRVLNIHKETDSPYNTYRNAGLPPGPICIPSISSIDAVLNYTDHNYLFFCAKADFSGYHSFARTYPEHLINARRFQRELDRRKITS